METWLLADLARAGLTVAALVYIWNDFKGRVEKQNDYLTAAIGKKADMDLYREFKSDVQANLTRIEDRQTREVEGLRTEMGELKQHMDRRFDQIIDLLVKK